jgi:hypothetical protein
MSENSFVSENEEGPLPSTEGPLESKIPPKEDVDSPQVQKKDQSQATNPTQEETTNKKSKGKSSVNRERGSVLDPKLFGYRRYTAKYTCPEEELPDEIESHDEGGQIRACYIKDHILYVAFNEQVHNTLRFRPFDSFLSDWAKWEDSPRGLIVVDPNMRLIYPKDKKDPNKQKKMNKTKSTKHESVKSIKRQGVFETNYGESKLDNEYQIIDENPLENINSVMKPSNQKHKIDPVRFDRRQHDPTPLDPIKLPDKSLKWSHMEQYPISSNKQGAPYLNSDTHAPRENQFIKSTQASSHQRFTNYEQKDRADISHFGEYRRGSRDDDSYESEEHHFFEMVKIAKSGLYHNQPDKYIQKGFNKFHLTQKGYEKIDIIMMMLLENKISLDDLTQHAIDHKEVHFLRFLDSHQEYLKRFDFYGEELINKKREFKKRKTGESANNNDYSENEMMVNKKMKINDDHSLSNSNLNKNEHIYSGKRKKRTSNIYN